jgi:hypothetical protein
LGSFSHGAERADETPPKWSPAEPAIREIVARDRGWDFEEKHAALILEQVDRHGG